MQSIEFKTPRGQRLRIKPEFVVAVGEAPDLEGAAACWIHTKSGQHLVAGSIDMVTSALGSVEIPSRSLAAADPRPSPEIEFMRLERARAELRLAQVKLQVAEVGRRGRRLTGSGEG